MKSQVGRYTVAHESEVYPYFTINTPRLSLLDGSRGGVQAFFDRLDFAEGYQRVLDSRGIVVDSDGGFQYVKEEDRLWLLVLFQMYEAHCRERDEHETL